MSRVGLRRLFAPVDVASLVFFRIAFGAILFWEVARYFAYGWIESHWIEPTFRFSYYGFGGIAPWPGDGMYGHFVALGALSLCVLVGLAYRVTTTLFFLGFTYVFLLDQTTYLNHFYLICLVAFLMIFVPAHRALSVDAWWQPGLRGDTAPAWSLWLLRAQIAVPYFFGGIAKLKGDWLRGEPMRGWLAETSDFPLLGRWFDDEWMVYLSSYGGLLLDLLIVPLLLWRRTRAVAFVAATGFHLANSRLFGIGIFPWFMIAATTLYFEPDWPRRLLGGKRAPARAPARAAAPDGTLTSRQRRTAGLLAAWLVVQGLVPLRHFLYPGPVSWTEEGLRFAWHMKLYWKESRSRFHATDPARGLTWEIDPLDYLTPYQLGQMRRQPDMVLQFCRHVAERLRTPDRPRVEVRATLASSLNGRRPQLAIDPGVDLAAQPRTLRAAPWIVPLRVPFDDRLRAGQYEALLGPSAVQRIRRGRALRERGRLGEAVALLQEAVRIDPQNAEARGRLGEVLAESGRLDEALAAGRAALELDRRSVPAHLTLGIVLGARGRLADAVGHFRSALEQRPADARLHYNLGVALAGTGRGAEALAALREARRREPDWAEPPNVMASILATHPDAALRDPTEAVRLAELAAHLTGQEDPHVLDTLAAAYAASGRFDEAAVAARDAIGRARARGAEALATEIERRLTRYERGLPADRGRR